MNASSREALWFHLLFSAAAVPVLLFAHGPGLGQGLLWLVIGYNLALPLAALLRGHHEWLSLWVFLLPVSAAQVLPDWALVQVAHTLVFPDHGQPRIGGVVPVYFAGMWMLLLFPLLLIGSSGRGRYFSMGLLALLLFAFWEWAARPLELWYGRDVRMLYGVALYTLIPELLLCLSALWMFRLTRSSGLLSRVAGGLCVPVFYTGALFVSLILCG